MGEWGHPRANGVGISSRKGGAEGRGELSIRLDLLHPLS